MKICNKCKKEQPKANFYTDRSHKDSLSSNCKSCKDKVNKIYQKENSAKVNAKNSRWKKNNLVSAQRLSAKRRAVKKQATPDWLTAAQLEEMVDIYKQAKELEQIFFNRKFHVDHIIPLQGKDVCGLHVPWNLQILTAEENIKKGYSYGTTQPNRVG